MKEKRLIVNYLYVENTFIYKIKDLLKSKDNKYIIDYNTLLDKSLDKQLEHKEKKILTASLIIKKLKKILLKNNHDVLNIYYVLNSFDDAKIKNLNTIIYNYFDGEIVNNIYTDYKDINSKIFSNICKPEFIKK